MISHRLLRYSIAFCVFLATGGLIAALNLPDNAMLPIHWNSAGEAERFVNKWEAAFAIPTSAVLLSVLVTWLPNVPLLRRNMDHNRPVYEGTWAVVLAVLGFAQYTVFAGAFGLQVMMPEGLFLLMALLLGLLGNYMPKLKPSPMIGIRTPWTLRNDDVWVKTHRFGGKLLIATSILTAATVLLSFGTTRIVTVFLISILASIFLSALWSYLLWKEIEAKSE